MNKLIKILPIFKKSIFRYSFSTVPNPETLELEPKKTGRILDYKNDIAFFENFEEKNLKFLRILSTQDKKFYLMLLSLNEKVSAAGFLSKIDSDSEKSLFSSNLEIVEEKDMDEKFNVKITEKIDGKIINFLGKELNGESSNDNVDEKEIKKIFMREVWKGNKNSFKRKLTNSQIWTGNLSTDFSKPIAKGNFVLIKGDSNTGKSFFCSKTAALFSNQNKNKSILNPNLKQTKTIYITTNYKSAERIKGIMNQSNATNDFVVFTTSKDSNNIEKYILPFSAVSYANYLKNENYDVLLIFDDVLDHYFKELLVFNTINQPFGPLNIINEIQTITGNFDKGSITSFIVIDTNQTQLSFAKEVENKVNHCESLSNVILDFNLKDDHYRNIRTKLDFNLYRNLNFWQVEIVKNLTNRLRIILEKLKLEKNSLEGKKDLKIHVDPWEAYLFLDSTYFMKMLILNDFYEPLECVLIAFLTVKSIEEDVVSQFKHEPDQLIKEFLNFCKNYKEFDGKDIITLINEKLGVDVNDKNLTNFIMENLNRLFELFIVHLKMNDKLLPYKKDYFT